MLLIIIFKSVFAFSLDNVDCIWRGSSFQILLAMGKHTPGLWIKAVSSNQIFIHSQVTLQTWFIDKAPCSSPFPSGFRSMTTCGRCSQQGANLMQISSCRFCLFSILYHLALSCLEGPCTPKERALLTHTHRLDIMWQTSRTNMEDLFSIRQL